jgi:hypothetical protein
LQRRAAERDHGDGEREKRKDDHRTPPEELRRDRSHLCIGRGRRHDLGL